MRGQRQHQGPDLGPVKTGQSALYDDLPSFCSDLFELGYEALGEVHARLETVADWK